MYGTTLRRHLADSAFPFVQGVASQPVKVVSCKELAAIVSPVLLAEFESTTTEERLKDTKYLEAMIRSHDAVARAIQLERTILPVRLGLVYPSEEELLAALEPAHDRLMAQLESIEGCDEWDIKLYAARSTIRQRIAAIDPELRELQQALNTMPELAVSDLAQDAYDRLSRLAKAAELDNRLWKTPAQGDEIEVLRAALIVPRSQLRDFLNEIHHLSEGDNRMRYEYSGPRAPYSYAKLEKAKLLRGILQRTSGDRLSKLV